jgi:ABC-type Zn uptake system ZnuABC Zn-binding protein ZnuA
MPAQPTRRSALSTQRTEALLRRALAALVLLAGCAGPPPAAHSGPLRIVAVETFLADIARAVTGDAGQVASLMPVGADPHTYEPTPSDVRRVLESDVLVANGAQYDAQVVEQLRSNAPTLLIVTAAAGIEQLASASTPTAQGPSHGPRFIPGDPHLWLDPVNVVSYAETIRDQLIRLDPANAARYAANTEAYRAELLSLDQWIRDQVQGLPPQRRLLVTNHESLAYFAARYGFTIVGTLLPGLSSTASPSARDLARLVDAIRAANVPVIFLEVGSDKRLADQLAQETGVRVISDLYTESLSAPSGPAPTYLEMMRYDTRAIVSALGAPGS